MQYQVPQFIEVEDKIVGPLTFRQFAYLLGGAGLSFVLYTIFPLSIAILFIIPTVVLALGLAFYKVNNKPLIFVISSAINYIRKSRLYVWKKVPKKIQRVSQEKMSVGVHIPKLSESKLKELSWGLGVKESIYSDSDKESRVRNDHVK